MNISKILICKYCGKKYVYNHNKQTSLKYCSKQCRIFDRLNLPKQRKLHCEVCGKEYTWYAGQENWVKEGNRKTKGSFSCLKYCSYDCGKSVSRTKAKITALKNYGVDNPAKSQVIQNKIANTSMLRYGYKNIAQLPQRNLKYKDPEYTKKIKDKEKETRKKKLEQDPEYWHKISKKDYLTKKKNKSFASSKDEKIIFDLLQKKFVDVKHPFNSEKYPFNCDFYIPALDLYIEYNRHWMHGIKPFDNTNIDCIRLVETWKNKQNELNFKGKKKLQYKYAIEVYTKSDPEKRRIAKENNLNWIEFFNLDQFMVWYNSQ